MGDRTVEVPFLAGSEEASERNGEDLQADEELEIDGSSAETKSSTSEIIARRPIVS